MKLLDSRMFLILLRELHLPFLGFADPHAFHSGNIVFMSIMINRMLLSLKRTATKGSDQDWGVSDNVLDPPSTLRIARDGARFSSLASHSQFGNGIPIPMEVIHSREERDHI